MKIVKITKTGAEEVKGLPPMTIAQRQLIASTLTKTAHNFGEEADFRVVADEFPVEVVNEH